MEKKINKIVELTDEKNYLANILEARDESGLDLETIILNRIDDIYSEIERLEGEK